MHLPGRSGLRCAMKVLRWFAWLPIERFLRGPIRTFNDLDGHEVIEIAVGKPIEYMALYMGNGSRKSKLTVLVKTAHGREAMIVKLGRTALSADAIANEFSTLKALETSPVSSQIPVVYGEMGRLGCWTWSRQSVLPRGESPWKLQKEHFDFLNELKSLGISHGDFTPWNCCIVDGHLLVWDWEDAHTWREGEDEAHFKCQTERLLMKKATRWST